MAKTYVENALVERVFDTSTGSTGVSVVEENTVGERTYKVWLTLWFKRRPEVRVGDRVNASGFLSVKTRSYDSPSGLKTVADVSLNGAAIQSVQPGAGPVEEPPAEDDAWASSDGWQ